MIRRLSLPLCVFVTTLALHYLWLGLFPETDPIQDQWATVVASQPSWWLRYIEGQSYYLGYSYALALTFAAEALRRYREDQACAARNMAVGSVSFSGVLAVAGCYLLGCCGSPMLAVYLSVFGAAFLPFAKPLIAVLTTLTIGLSWWWMVHLRTNPTDSTGQLKDIRNQ